LSVWAGCRESGGNAIISVIIPAHNEAAVIGRCLGCLTEGADARQIEVIVVCNGCHDATADRAAEFGPIVRIIETPVASKTNALNLGDDVATGFPRIYLDADILISFASLLEIAAALQSGEVLAAWPSVLIEFPAGAQWSVQAFYKFWMALPYIQEGMIAAGAYAVSAEGKQRFQSFPDVIADDGYVRLLFSAAERLQVPSAFSRVTAPANIRDLVRIRTRSRVGAMQLKARFPDLFRREARTRRYGSAIRSVLVRPDLYACAMPYLWVNFVSRLRAGRQFRKLDHYVWERDESSR
jgi:glycosyltransferase involved in cell wall biosynthesis